MAAAQIKNCVPGSTRLIAVRVFGHYQQVHALLKLQLRIGHRIPPDERAPSRMPAGGGGGRAQTRQQIEQREREI